MNDEQARELIDDCFAALSGGIIASSLYPFLVAADPLDEPWLAPSPIALGEAELMFARGGELAVWETRAAWRAAGHGIVILDFPAVAAMLLNDERLLVCETLALAERLDAALRTARDKIMPAVPRLAIGEGGDGDHQG